MKNLIGKIIKRRKNKEAISIIKTKRIIKRKLSGQEEGRTNENERQKETRTSQKIKSSSKTKRIRRKIKSSSIIRS